jgi:hypothetical protein
VHFDLLEVDRVTSVIIAAMASGHPPARVLTTGLACSQAIEGLAPTDRPTAGSASDPSPS